jgi:hypothetical protein
VSKQNRIPALGQHLPNPQAHPIQVVAKTSLFFDARFVCPGPRANIHSVWGGMCTRIAAPHFDTRSAAQLKKGKSNFSTLAHTRKTVHPKTVTTTDKSTAPTAGRWEGGFRAGRFAYVAPSLRKICSDAIVCVQGYVGGCSKLCNILQVKWHLYQHHLTCRTAKVLLKKKARCSALQIATVLNLD